MAPVENRVLDFIVHKSEHCSPYVLSATKAIYFDYDYDNYTHLPIFKPVGTLNMVHIQNQYNIPDQMLIWIIKYNIAQDTTK